MNDQEIIELKSFMEEYHRKIKLLEEAEKQDNIKIIMNAVKDFYKMEEKRNQYLIKEYLEYDEKSKNLNYFKNHSFESHLDKGQKIYNLLMCSNDLLVGLKLKLSGMFKQAADWDSKPYTTQRTKLEEMN